MNAAINAFDNMITHQEAVGNQIGEIHPLGNAYDQIANVANANIPDVVNNIIPLTTIDHMHLEGVLWIKVCAE